MVRHANFIFAGLISLFFFCGPVFAGPINFVTFEGTPVSGINDSGEVVVNYLGNLFLRKADGSMTPLSLPGFTMAPSTQSLVQAGIGLGINDLGEIVGTVNGQGILRLQDGTIQWFNIPTGALITGINDSHQVVGSIYGSCTDSLGRSAGSCAITGDLNGNFTTFLAQNETVAFGINDVGDTVGTTHNAEYAWRRSSGTGLGSFRLVCQTLSTFYCGSLTWEDVAFGINNQGQVAGVEGVDLPFGCDPSDVACLIANPPGNPFNSSHGYIWQPDGTFLAVDYPGAHHTYLTGINDAGQVVGYYEGPNGEQGFVATVTPEPGTLVFAGIALASLGLMWRFRYCRRVQQTASCPRSTVT